MRSICATAVTVTRRGTVTAPLKRNMPGEIRLIAKFLDIPINEARWEAILEHVSRRLKRDQSGQYPKR